MRADVLAEVLGPAKEIIAPTDDLTVSQWADQNRVLDFKESAIPGKFRTSLTPYIRLIQDAGGNPDVDEIVLRCSAQGGKSEAVRNMLGYWITNDPGPCMWVLPDELSAEKQIEKRLKPMIENSIPWVLSGGRSEITKVGIKLATMDICPSWAGSPTRLASDANRYAIGDEVDKWPRFSGRDASPRALLKARLKTYESQGRSKFVLVSTPTTSDGPISVEFENTPDKRDYRLPCVSCGDFMPMSWGMVKWEKKLEGEEPAVHAERIFRDRAAWIECPHCGARNEESDRRVAIGKGRWFSSLGLDETSFSRKMAFHFSSLVVPWANLSALAAKFIVAKGDVGLLFEFITQELGEPFEERVSDTRGIDYKSKCVAAHKTGIVPSWASLVLATADTQKNSWYWTVRAWGRGYRSRGIAHGQAYSLDELVAATLDSRWSIENFDSQFLESAFLLVDSGGSTTYEDDGSITDMIYRFAETDPERIIPVKGYGGKKKAPRIISTRTIEASKQGPHRRFGQVDLRVLDTQSLKDILFARIQEPDMWEEHAGIDADYCRQMESERKVPVRVGSDLKMVWRAHSSHTANHYWDNAVYQCAGALIAQAAFLPDLNELETERENQNRIATRVAESARESHGITGLHGRDFLANWR